MNIFPTPATAILMAAGIAGAQPVQPVVLPQPDDSGWIDLFRGNNTSDFYDYTSNEGNKPPSQAHEAFPGGPFTIVGGDTIATSGNPYALLMLHQNFSYYRAQVQVRWPGALCNSGLITKIQINDTTEGGSYPRSVECQGDPNQGMGQVWALGEWAGKSPVGTWITVHAKVVNNRMQADSTAPEIDWGGDGGNSTVNDNLCVGFAGWQQPRPAALNNGGWITIEVESHGSDTTRHFIDGQKVMQYTNPRVAPPNNANQVVKYLTKGVLALQSEGGTLWFRHFRIMLLPGDSLYSSLYPTWIRSHAITAKAPQRPLLKFDGSELGVDANRNQIWSLTGRTLSILPFKANE